MNLSSHAPRPNKRRLRVYAFDPSLSTRGDTAMVNHVVLEVPWEETELEPGPVGEYVEVVDVDPASGRLYPPVDLNDPFLLAQDGLTPSEGDPQFHQQMVYAVVMRTIRNFEKALGRRALWSGHSLDHDEDGGSREQPSRKVLYGEQFVQRLRVYPHALREANAYYSPDKKALLFGYFPASETDPGKHYPGGIVFTCLSQDVVAHETSHALLDGMHRRFIERSNEDSLAFHEAFADIVALFQHFSLSQVLEHQIAKTRGDLQSQNLLGQLAQQFGQATGAHGALRDALGKTDEQNKWHPRVADPDELARTHEPHARGALLVAAVFDAFLSIYKSRIADLLRIATGGTGELPKGEISTDLVKRLADEAAKSAQHVLTMCIRALDYLPPVDVTFGDYLRALITADFDLMPDDPRRYRVAFIESFRRFGIYPRGMRNMSDESLRWLTPAQLGFTDAGESVIKFSDKLKEQLTKFAGEWRASGGKIESAQSAQPEGRSVLLEGKQFTFREAVFTQAASMREQLHAWLLEAYKDVPAKELRESLGFDKTILNANGEVCFEVHSLRPTRRVGPDGDLLLNMVIEVTQSKPAWITEQNKNPDKPDFYFRGGVTLMVDMETNEIRYILIKDVTSDKRLQRQRDFLAGKFRDDSAAATDTEDALRMSYFGSNGQPSEPFALLHRSAPNEGAVRSRLDKTRVEQASGGAS